ncbi:MAG: bifunctional DNA-formamidopyrimidine glycosylase/DNA-(apurinic or apyrimidinic site) lyase [Gammaproteobacteria bacterium]|nr:bifunctional DNA-formamidopyrimidine glycosylase/DNA-(apurinic or apyrimidinic site) lyase [Gammaproteobacteria bacterium]
MPELPEVETTRRGIAPYLLGTRFRKVVIREPRLRWPVPRALGRKLADRKIRDVGRRAKYLLLHTDGGCLLLHLGMSGSLRILHPGVAAGAHDHADFHLSSGRLLRLRDPRRFGSIHWTVREPGLHRLLRDLGPEPLGPDFHGAHLRRKARGRRAAVKSFLMDSRVVAGLGNIYANESLFLAGIHPARAAGRISQARYERLATAVKKVLRRAIRAGGTTLRDFTDSQGRPGYFRLTLRTYGRAGRPCLRCGTEIRLLRISSRATYYCPRCQR